MLFAPVIGEIEGLLHEPGLGPRILHCLVEQVHMVQHQLVGVVHMHDEAKFPQHDAFHVYDTPLQHSILLQQLVENVICFADVLIYIANPKSHDGSISAQTHIVPI